ncbi:MAG: NERD domain-containing protein [bacterium]
MSLYNKNIISNFYHMDLRNIIGNWNKQERLSSKDHKKLWNLLKTNDNKEIILKIMVILLLDDNETFNELKEKFYFSYFFKHEEVCYYVKNLLDNHINLGLENKDIAFLKTKSQINLENDFYSKLLRRIHDYLKMRPWKSHRLMGNTEYSFQRSILSFVEVLMVDNYRYGNEDEIKLGTNDYYAHDVVNATSFIIHQHNKVFGSEEINSFHVYIDNNYFESLIRLACEYLKVKEFELFHDYYDYSLNKSNNRIDLNPPKNNLEKTLRLGAIKNDLSDYFRAYDFRKIFNNHPDISDIVSETKKGVKNDYIVFKKQPYKRYILKFDFEILSMYKRFWNNLDDVIYLDKLNEEYHADSSERLKKIQITPELNFDNIFEFWKIILLIWHVYKEIYNKNNQVTIRNSSILILDYKTLYDFYDEFDCDTNKLEDVIYFFSGIPSSELYDLFYTPIIKKTDKQYMFSPYIFANSNILRNAVINARKNDSKIVNNYEENLTNHLYKSLLQAGFDIKKNITMRENGIDYEIDLLLIGHDHTYVFECKSPLSPASEFEIRSTYETLKKGSRQLNNIKQMSSLKETLKKKNINIKSESYIFSIINGNRFFVGHEINNIPIINAAELINVCTIGEIMINGRTYRIWKNKDFHEMEIIRYIRGEIITKFLFEGMEEYQEDFKIYGKTLRSNSFRLNSEKLENSIIDNCVLKGG